MAAPQLRLEVSLNLAGFRNEVRKLTQIAQSEFNPLLKVDVDTRDYRAQLKALERIKPVIKIEDSQLDAARARIGTLNKSLATLRRATSTPIEIKLKYTEIGKPPSTAAGQVGRAVSGGVRGSQALEGANRSELLNIRKMMSEAGMALGKITSLSKATASELRNSIIPAFTNSGEEAVNGLAAGLKDSSSKIGKIAAKVGVEAVNGIKGALGIASPSRVFKQIGEFSVDGLELGFLNGLKDFKGKSVAEIRKIVALLKLELAKVSEGGGIGGPSMGSLRRQLVGQRAYTSPIGPLPVGSREPYAKGTRGQFGYSGYEPRMVSRPYTGGPRFPVEGMMAPRPEFGFASTGQSQPTGQAAGRSRENTILGAMGGYNPGVRSSAMFPMGGMMGPSSPLGRITPQSSMFAGGGGGSPGGGGPGGGGPGGGGGGPLGGMRLNVPQLPGSGVVRELGEEFGFAAKQVLLFGTAYKALAFLQSFPGQVGEAVGALQSFRNTLKTVTPSAAEFDKSSKFILSLVDQYNVPLQSARDGFAKLYASMKPAGFSGAEIRGLFEGVSMGAATFGMSADKVDRVMYAFAQMASKGQVMSEELKGQLGDALPGALSLFAKAADMSVQEFGQAMEDGAFKGEAMRQLLVNVGATMKEEFGKGAVGAAVTYQGVMNRLQTTTVLFYEAFEPAAVAFANTFILPITNGIRIVTDAFAQLLTGQKAITQGGSELAARMQPLIPIFQGIGDNLRQVATAAFNTVKALLPVVQFLLQLAASPVIGFLAQMYASLLLLNGAFTLLGGRLLIGVIASLAQTAIRMTALNAATVITNGSLAGTQLQLRMLSAGFAQTGAAATGFAMTMRTAMMTTVVGAIVAAVAIGIAEFMRLRGVMASIEGRYKSLGDQARLMGEAGNVSGVQKITTQVKEQAQTYEDLAKALNRAEKAGGFLKLDQKGRELLKRTGQSGFDAGTGIITNEDANKIKDAINRNREETKNLLGGVLPGQESKARAEAAKLDAKLEKQKIDLSAGDGTGKPPKEQSLESYYGLQDQLAKNFTQDQLDRMEQEYQARVNRINSEFDLREARANSFQKEAIRFERQISDIELKRQKALLDASAEVIKAQGSVAGGAGGQSTTGATGLLQGSTGISSGAHFDVRRQDGSYISPEQAKALFDPSVRRQLAMTSAYGPRRAPVPGASTFHKGVDLAGPANTPLNLAPGFAMTGSGEKGGLGYAASVRGPSGEMYDVGHLQRPTAGMGTPRKVTGDEKRDVIADQKAQLAVAQQSLTVRIADAQAVRDAAVAWAQYSASIVPVEEQALQNDILAKKNELVRVSMPEDVIEKELKYFEAQQKTTLAIANNNKLLKNGLIDEKQHAKNLSELQTRLAGYNTELDRNIQLQRQQSFDASMGALQKQITMATPVGGTGLAAGFMGDAGAKYEEAIKEGRSQDEAARFAELQNQLTLLETRNGAVKSSVLAIGDAFATAMTTGVAGLISGTATAQEVFASFLKSIGDALLQAAQQMIATYIAIGIAKIFAGLGGGGGGGAMPGAAPQMTPGAIVTPTGFSGQFAGIAGNGATFANGIASFARGGTFSNSIVSSPTMFKFADGGAMRTGLMGEAGPEAIMPLSRGADGSLGVQANGLREAMDRQQGGASGSPVLNMSFQSTSINGVEYVSRDQLESAMAETRRASTRDGAKRGMTMTLDRIQNSSSTRRKVGI
jgi:tape measure domain-containing protein